MGFWAAAAPALIGAAGSILGGAISGEGQRKAASMNADLQREFAQHGISWRVADAKRSGIHPLAALGAQLHQAQPSYVGGSDYGLTNAGQYAGQAIARGSSLDNEYKQALIDKTRAEIDAINASLPGQGSITKDPTEMSGAVSVIPAEQISKVQPGTNAGVHGTMQFNQLPGQFNEVIRGLSEKQAEIQENDWEMKFWHLIKQLQKMDHRYRMRWNKGEQEKYLRQWQPPMSYLKGKDTKWAVRLNKGSWVEVPKWYPSVFFSEAELNWSGKARKWFPPK